MCIFDWKIFTTVMLSLLGQAIVLYGLLYSHRKATENVDRAALKNQLATTRLKLLELGASSASNCITDIEVAMRATEDFAKAIVEHEPNDASVKAASVDAHDAMNQLQSSAAFLPNALDEAFVSAKKAMFAYWAKRDDLDNSAREQQDMADAASSFRGEVKRWKSDLWAEIERGELA